MVPKNDCRDYRIIDLFHICLNLLNRYKEEGVHSNFSRASVTHGSCTACDVLGLVYVRILDFFESRGNHSLVINSVNTYLWGDKDLKLFCQNPQPVCACVCFISNEAYLKEILNGFEGRQRPEVSFISLNISALVQTA